jgi:tetratricopeptide (TPR) repeat protein
MLSLWIPLGIIILSALVLIVMAIRKIPYLRALDVLSAPEQKAKNLKRAIIASRLSRAGAKYGERMKKFFSPIVGAAKSGGRKAAEKVSALEERYQKLRRESMGPHALTPETIKEMIDKAETLIKEARYGEAEKILIEVLSHDAKSVEAYESLGYLFMLQKNYDQAEETYNFILKIQPGDASVLTSLGEIELARNNPEKAKGYFDKAVKKRPHNPKYLDFLVEASIEAKDASSARRALEQLRGANPENQKLSEFEERIQAIK